MSSLGFTVINFTDFFPFIEDALDEKGMYSSRMIVRKDYPFLIPALQTYLIRKCKIFSLVGYVEEPVLTAWFDYETLIEAFDDLLLQFREYLSSVKGLDLNSRYTLVRYLDNFNFIIAQGEQDDPVLDYQYTSLVDDCEQMVTECDPFL